MWIGDSRCHPCLSLRNCQTNLHPQTEIAVTPSAVCIRTANRDKTTKNIFFFFFTSRVTWVCYEMETYSPCLWSVWTSLCDIPVRLCSHRRAADISMIPFCTPFASGSAIVLKLNVKEKNNEKNTHSLTLTQRESPCFFFLSLLYSAAKWKPCGEETKGWQEKCVSFLFVFFFFFPPTTAPSFKNRREVTVVASEADADPPPPP